MAKRNVKSDAEIRGLILAIIEMADYDLYKAFIPECSESSPEDIDIRMNELILVVRKYMGW